MLKLREEPSEIIDAHNLKLGEIGVVTYPEGHKGKLVQRSYGRLVAIGLPCGSSWNTFFIDKNYGAIFVKPLRTGDVLEYTKDIDNTL